MAEFRFSFFLVLAATAAAISLLGWLLNGSARWAGVSVVLLIAGFVSGVLWQRKSRRARSATGESEAFPADVVNFSPDLLNATINEMREGLLVIDADMRVVASNRAAQQLLSNFETPLNSRRLTELTRNPAIYDAFLDAVRGTERAGVKVETYSPGRRVFDLRVVPLRTASGVNGAVGVFFDVTRLERLEIIRQEFLSNVSHELRTPLTSIVALSETLEVGAIDDPKNNRRFLSIIQKNAARMHRLIDDILELSAIEAGNVKLQPELVRLRAVVEDVVGSLDAVAASRHVTISNLVSVEAEVFADPHRLMQMLTNLIDNAIKFNREGGTVSIGFSRTDRDHISVEDTGEGIPSHHLDRLFERFYRVDRARSRELGGTGLGLAIVKHLARSHGGEVSVQSRFGEGTQFTIDLPPRPVADNDAVLSATAAHG
ncbi:MAG TPA: ATP-binding protein [Pyrinomonadaceae bacterium]|nr:ATP-binding protein [Pyrinomonadaceae bacterium]